MQEITPAQLYATVAGAVLAILGIAGFFYEASFDTGDPGLRSGEVLGVIAVNGWSNLLHLATGLALLAAAATGAARGWALGLGLAFTILAGWGLAADDSILSLIPVDSGTSLVHLAVGLTGLASGAASPEPATSR